MRRLSVLFACLVLQLSLVSATFPIVEILTDRHLFYIDSPFHWFHTTKSGELLRQKRLTGYDATFNAGTLTGFAFNYSAKLPSLLYLLVPSVDATQAWKIFSFGCALLGPPLISGALILLGVRPFVVLAGTVFALLLWWTSLLRWYHTAGMTAFVIVGIAAVFYWAILLRTLNDARNWIMVAVCGLVGAFLFLVHPFFAVVIALGVISYLAVAMRTLNLVWTASALATIVTISIVPNLVWLVPLYFGPSLDTHLHSYQQWVGFDLLMNAALGLWRGNVPGAKLDPVLIVLACYALFASLPPWYRSVRTASFFWGIGLIVYGCFASLVEPLGPYTQPNRFVPIGFMALVLPASFGLVAAIDDFIRPPKIGRIVPAALVALTITVTVFGVHELRREILAGEHGHYGISPPEVTGVGPTSKMVLHWLEKHTTAEGRVLFEASLGRVHDKAHVAGYLAVRAQREFIGGPYPEVHLTGTADGNLFGKPVGTIGPERFREYLDLYNIGWIVAFSESTNAYLEGSDILSLVERSGTFTLYRVNQQLSYFIEADGIVTPNPDGSLRLSRLVGESVTIKYHYFPGMHADAGTAVEPVSLLDDPQPFIRLRNPPTSLTISTW